MASFSSANISSSQHPKWKYDVFLSFRGEDTRKTITSHLYKDLERMGILTFQDDKRLELGSSIPFELCKAIEESQFALIIFSVNYASSGWCLEELVKIIKCKAEFGQTVIPVFYNVDPTTIRHQTESFAKAFAQHETRYKDDVEGMQKVQRWRTALTTAANLTGHDIRNRIEAECVQKIVDVISSKLCKSTLSSSLQDVVGINTHVEKVKSILEKGDDEVRIIGIWGMGGIGKTTIAKAIFYNLSDKFDATCLLADVKENEQRHQLYSLQNTLLSELLKNKNDYINNEHDGKELMSRRLRSMKVLIVLDDIDHTRHLEYLVGDLDWFGKGSRIIVTTRNKHLIENDDAVYEVTTLPRHEAIKLFYQHAFRKDVPDERFKKLSLEVVNHAKGLPLALKVWGSFLHKRNIIEWENGIEQMKNSANSEIIEKLKISYDGLGAIEQQMFLDIACFFRGHSKKISMPILDSCFVGANIGLSVLIEKSLVVISEDNTIEMHDLIQDMGKYVVNVQKDLGKPSRVWLAEDFEKVIFNNTGTVEAIWIENQPNLQISKKAMKNMNRLRMLGLQDNADRISFHDDSFKYLSNNMRCFSWSSCPWESLPANFELKRLVHLQLHSSKLLFFGKETKDLEYLRKLDVSGSERLIETPDFTRMTNLEDLDLSYCISLEEIHPSIGDCTKLIRLNLNACISLKWFPCVNVESLEYLCLINCYSLEKFPEIIGNMKSEVEIHMGKLAIRELPSSIFQYPTPHITKLKLYGLKNLATIPNIICKLKSLVTLDVSYCSKLESLPKMIGDLENLEKLHASFTLISQPPPSLLRLKKLKILRFEKERKSEGQATEYFFGLLTKFRTLRLEKRKSEEGQATAHFVFPRVNKGFRSLEELNLSCCNLIEGGLMEDIGCLSSLKRLYLKGINFDHLPKNFSQLSALEVLDVSYCKMLKELPKLPPNVVELWADVHVGPSIQKYENLNFVEFTPLSVECDDISDLFTETLLKCILSLRKALSASDSLSQRVFSMWHPATQIPDWFKYHNEPGKDLVMKLRENWYANDNFLGFAICYSGKSYKGTVELITLSNDDNSKKLSKSLTLHYSTAYRNGVNFYFIPLASLWDTAKTNGKTPNGYGYLRLSTTCDNVSEFGLSMLYKIRSLRPCYR